MEAAPNRVRELREARDWSQDTFAPMAGLTKSSLHRIERGTTQLDVPTMRKIAKAFGVKPSALLLDEDVECRAEGSAGELMEALGHLPEAERPRLAKFARELVDMVRRQTAAATGGLQGDPDTVAAFSAIWNAFDRQGQNQILALMNATGFAERAAEFRRP